MMENHCSDYIIGIDIGGTYFRIGMVDKHGHIANFVVESSGILNRNGGHMKNLQDYISEFIEKYGSGRLLAISIGFPSAVSRDKKVVFQSPNIQGFNNMDVGGFLGDAFCVPVFVDNDVSNLLIYEITKRGLEDDGTVIGIYFGTGLGNAIYMHGEIMEGKHGIAGELGHIPIHDNVEQCGCGNARCMETVASGKRLEELQKRHFPDTVIKEIFKYHKDEPVIQEFVEALSIPIAVEMNIFDPDYIIVGGGVINMDCFPKEDLEKYVYRHARKPYPAEDFKISYASGDKESGVIGAAYNAYRRLGINIKKQAEAKMSGKISPSIMCADFKHLEENIRILEQSGVEYLHFDIMDGSFVPNFTLGPDLMKAVRDITGIPFDIHLMVTHPENHIGLFDIEPGDIVSVHQEATIHLQRTLQRIKDYGAKAAVALNPATPIYSVEDVLDDIDVILIMTVNPGFAGQKLVPATIRKIVNLKKYLTEKGYFNVEIEVDGNVSYENARRMREAGADIFVAGTSSLFVKGRSISASVEELRKCIV